MPSLPDLPWRQLTPFLLLDGVTMGDLPALLTERQRRHHAHELYLGNRWHGLADIGPAVIPLDGPDDPLLADYLSRIADEPGALLFSDQDPFELNRHLSWLITVTVGESEPQLLRVGEPAVMHGLFSHSLRHHRSDLFGPIALFCWFDGGVGQWRQVERPGPAPNLDYAFPYSLTSGEFQQLEEVSFRQTVRQLDQHMRRYFPSYCGLDTAAERYQHLHRLASEAYELGFCSEEEITLYANIFGLLGDNAPLRHPSIHHALYDPAKQPAARVRLAAERAWQICTTHQARMPQ